MKIRYKPEAIKQLKKNGAKDISKICKKIESLSVNPFGGKLLQGQLKGVRSLRAWPLRIIYTIDQNLNCIIIETVDYRGDVHKK
jgi:mRNA-degrading endonuclease RelE of RelBE toxin-antitoxin system